MTALIRSMPEGWVIRGMVEQRRLAAHARCRIMVWHLGHVEAIHLARDVSGPFGEDLVAIYESMCAGNVMVLGAWVQVR